MINILYQSPWPVGGSTSYTVHLAKVLGRHARVLRIAKRTEGKKREIGSFGVHYQNVSLDAVLALKEPILLAASNPKQDENVWVELGKKKNVWATFHDPNEFALYPHWKHFSKKRVICIRTTGTNHIPAAHFIPHPYLRSMGNMKAPITKAAVSIARTSSIKHSDWILEANRRLHERDHIELLGEVNRMWANFYLAGKYPEFVAPPAGTYPRTFNAGVALCAPAAYMVDLTIFKGDGGGTQYTMLEAIDAGAVPVMTSEWCSYAGVATKLCFKVNNTAQLVTLMKQRHSDAGKIAEQRKHNYRYIAQVHAPESIKMQYLNQLL